MTWSTFHSRGEILRAVVEAAEQRRDGILPIDVPGVDEHFDSDLDLLCALMLKWHARLSGNIERALMAEPLDLEHAVAVAWRRTSDQMPGIRAVIDEHLTHPRDEEMAAAMTRAREREWIRLAAAAGLANDESPAAARAGRRVEDRARGLRPVETSSETAPATKPAGHHREGGCTSFVERIRAVLAA